MKVDFNTLYVVSMKRSGWPRHSALEMYAWAPTECEAAQLAALRCPANHRITKVKGYSTFRAPARLEIRLNVYLASRFARFIPDWVKRRV